MLANEVGCSWRRTVEPLLEPIDLDDAKRQARITHDASNTLLEGYIRAAREAAEDYLGRGLTTQTLELSLDDWAYVIPLPQAAPLQEVSSITYYDVNGAQQTLATSVYDTDAVARPAAVVLKPNQSWPALQCGRLNGRITVTYIVGWETADEIPESIRQGVRLYVTYLDIDRDGLEPKSLDARAAAERCWSDRVTWTPPLRPWCIPNGVWY